MPYSNPKQETAIFLNIKRKQGLAAAKTFANKVKREEGGAPKPYRPRRKRENSAL